MNEQIKVIVIPHAKKEYIEANSSNTFTVSVKEKTERNMANIRMRELLAQHFSVPMSAIQIVAGHRSPKKRIIIKK